MEYSAEGSRFPLQSVTKSLSIGVRSGFGIEISSGREDKSGRQFFIPSED